MENRMLVSNVYNSVKSVYHNPVYRRRMEGNKYHPRVRDYTPRRPEDRRYYATQKYLPIWDHVKITNSNGRTTFTTILHNTPPAVSNCPARVNEEWSTCVPMRAFRDWLAVVNKEYKGAVLGFEFLSDIETLRITIHQAAGVKSRTEFKCLNAAEFPICETEELAAPVDGQELIDITESILPGAIEAGNIIFARMTA